MLDIKPLYCINLKLKVVQSNIVEHHYHGCEQCSYIIAQNYAIGTFNKQREVTEKKNNKKQEFNWTGREYALIQVIPLVPPS